MTINDVLAEVERIRIKAANDEIAHGMEDDLHQNVLRAIADGTCDDPAGCARAVLTTQDISFGRWYA